MCLLLFLEGILWVHEAHATVFEFDASGNMTVYEAHDYRSYPTRAAIKSPQSQKIKKEKRPLLFDKEISDASITYGVSEELIHAVIQAESAYDPLAISSKGAGGLMQLMPATAKLYGASDRFSPEDNIRAGTKYLKHLLDKYRGDIILSVAAYNAGEGAVDRYGGIPPYLETIGYVRKISEALRRDNQ